MDWTGKQRRRVFNPRSIMDLVYLNECLIMGDHETCIYREGGNWIVRRLGSKTRLYQGKNEEEAGQSFWLSSTEDE